MRLVICTLAVPLLALAPALHADAIPYASTGTIAPIVDTYASSSGGVDIYYYGSTAAFTDYVGVCDVQTTYCSGQILNNHTTTVGSETIIGTAANTSGVGGPDQINAGDQLVFYIYSPQGTFSSIGGASSNDGDNHAYITPYSGGTQYDANIAADVTIPAGIYVGLEDETASDSDFNYNDDTFVFTGVSAPSIGVNPGPVSTTPEPASLTLLATGASCLAGVLRRRSRAA